LGVIVIVIGFFPFFSITITMTTHDHEGHSLTDGQQTPKVFSLRVLRALCGELFSVSSTLTFKANHDE
jgi:hypothetical protein